MAGKIFLVCGSSGSCPDDETHYTIGYSTDRAKAEQKADDLNNDAIRLNAAHRELMKHSTYQLNQTRPRFTSVPPQWKGKHPTPAEQQAFQASHRQAYADFQRDLVQWLLKHWYPHYEKAMIANGLPVVPRADVTIHTDLMLNTHSNLITYQVEEIDELA